MDKAKVWYGLLKEGGLENEDNVGMTAWCKDIIPVFEKLCALASVDIFLLA